MRTLQLPSAGSGHAARVSTRSRASRRSVQRVCCSAPHSSSGAGDAEEEAFNGSSSRPSYSAQRLYNLLGSTNTPIGSDHGEVSDMLRAGH